MTATLYQFFVPDAGSIRDSWLRTLRNGLIARGVANPNVTPGSDYYVMAQAFANEAAVGMANCVLKADELMPDTATFTALDRVATPIGLSRRAASGSLGLIVYSASATSVVTTGSVLLDSAGLRYQVSTGGTYNNGDLIPIAAIDTGSATNLATGSTLRWIAPPAFASTNALVNAGGLTNGVDGEDDETFRNRIYARLQTFPAGGNWQYVATIAEASSPSVQKAFVYPAIQGAATLHVAVVAPPTTTNKNRDVATATIAGSVSPNVQGQIPEHAFSLITTVANVPVDVGIGLALPAATTASPPGVGGGWLDGSPWPASITVGALVTAVTSTTQFTVNAQILPTLGVTHIAWLSPLTWTITNAIVTAVSGSSGAYTITIDTPMVGIATGNLIFPQSSNQATYITALLAFFALMGPGEKTTNASALIRGFRHPTPLSIWPYSLGPACLKAMTNSGSEVADAQFYLRYDGTATITGTAGILTPQVPGSVSSPPNIYVPRNIGLYPI